MRILLHWKNWQLTKISRDSRLEAEGLRKELEQLEVAILLEIWDTILE